mmetsp:Transcript_42862/g.71274  ORF Transcript_42862/g.71274 Transcript_42862/m.71274 type:complete len:265 (+) Transcript_42862:146-940(+)
MLALHVLPLHLPSWLPHLGVSTADHPALYVADELSSWTRSEVLEYDGLLVKRPFACRWDTFQGVIDEAEWAVLSIESASAAPRQFSLSVDTLLATAALPVPLAAQIREDACSLGRIWSRMCPEVKSFDVKLEILGENTCSRWHQDHFVGRGIVSYTGVVGTEYVRKEHVNFWELEHCGNNDHIIRDATKVESAAVGDILLIKGTKFPGVFNALVHKSPSKLYDDAGNILNRLVLKVDAVPTVPTVARPLLRRVLPVAPAAACHA